MGKDQELLEAARNGNVPVVEKILGQRAKRSGPLASLRRGPGANVQDSSGYSCLHHAALNGHSEIVRLLLDHDASTNIVDCRGSSPLHLAAWTGNVDIVRQLLSGPAITNVNLTTKDSETALHSAAQYGHTAVVEQLLDNVCDPAIRNSRGETALDLAAQYGRLETVELLLQRHRELIQPMRRAVPGVIFPHTPLHLASRNGHKGVVEALLGAGFDVNIRTSAGTALHEAAICGKVEVVRTLLDHGADISVRDAHGNTVMDLLGQFPAQATHEITSVIRKYARSNGSLMGDSDMDESVSQPFPPVPAGDSNLGSPYENVRPSSRGRSLTAESGSPGTSPSRWDYYRQSRSVDGCEDRRVSGTSAMSISRRHRVYKSMPIRLKPRPKKRTVPLPPPTIIVPRSRSPTILDSVTFSFSQQCTLRESSEGSSSSYTTTSPCSFRGSDNSVYQTPPAPKSFMDSSVHSEDLSFSIYPEADQISLSSTASSCGYRDRRLDAGSAPLYLPMNRAGHSPSSNNSKVSPTPPKKPPRRNLSVSPTHLQPMSTSVEGVSNNAYEYLFLARSGARSQSDLDDIDGKHSDSDRRRENHLRHGRSVDAYVEMNCVFSLGADELDEPLPTQRELQRGKSEDLDSRRPRPEPVAITAMYENTVIKTQNPRRKLRRHHERDIYEQYDFHKANLSPITSSSAPDTNYVTSAFLSIKSSQENLASANGSNEEKPEKKVVKLTYIPLSPTHYNQPPTPDHPPPSVLQAERSIHDRIRPLSQEYKRRSRDIETETEEEYLMFPCDESSGSLSSSISLSDKSVSTDNHVEEYIGDVPFAGLFKGSTKALDSLGTPRPIPAERPKTLRKLKHVYENANGGGMAKTEDLEINQRKIPPRTSSIPNTIPSSLATTTASSCHSADKDKEKDGKSLSILSPFDEQEEWAKIQEIMASFGTGLVRESVFVSELEKEFQTRLMSLSQRHMDQASNASTVEKWLSNLGMSDYESLFMSNGFDHLDFLNGVLEDNDLREMGIQSEAERQLILETVRQLSAKVQEQAPCNNNNVDESADTVDQWLRRIHLECYSETFSKHLYLDMDRIRRIWDVELSAVLEIEKVGHRKRILASVSGGEHITSGPRLEDINADLNMLNTNIQQLKEDIKSSPATQQSSNNTNTSTGTGTLRHRHKKSRPAPPPPIQVPATQAQQPAPPPKQEPLEIRGPSELNILGGTPLKAQWRHKPILLVTGAVNYLANYLGSTMIKELRGTESTKRSIQKLKKTATNVKPTPEIILSISYRGVKFLNTITKKLVCEHEIRNIHCVCQDQDDLTHFAYITKDHPTKSHYCHVFSTQTTDQATEVILTLGQAFEVAYQMALREQVTSRSKSKQQSYNHPARSPGSVSSKSKDCGKESPPSSRARSHSASDIKLNGHQLKMTPLSLSSEPFRVDAPPVRTPTKAHLSLATEDAKVTETSV